MDIGHKIYEIRKQHGLSQEQFAEKFHVTRQTVSNWENNKNYPDLDSLKQISDEFGISFDIEMNSSLNYIEKNGLKVYGFSFVADKETLLKMADDKAVYTIATEEY